MDLYRVQEDLSLPTGIGGYQPCAIMFTYTPLQGARSTSRASQSILELDGGIKILVDVGWDETFDPSMLIELKK